MNVRPIAALSLVAAAASLFAQTTTPPRTFLIDPAAYVRAKAQPTPELLRHVASEARNAMQTPPLSVTLKTQTPPSGDKHDYFSMAIYWWPDPKNPTGPYIHRDGEHNPEVLAIPDEDNLVRMIKATHALALSFYLTANPEHAARAALLLRTWFLAPATAMNPNMNYAQGIKGINDGRGAGLIDSHNLPLVIDAAALLAGSKDWTAGDDAGLRQWFTRYLEWLNTSPIATQEDATRNNHGSWFQAQIVPIELYLGKTAEARARLELIRTRRIPDQIAPNGDQKYELARTNSFFYSSYNLQALSIDAFIAMPLGIDLYQPAKPDGPGIFTALNSLLPYDAQHPWPHQEITSGREKVICSVLPYAAAKSPDPRYPDAMRRFGCSPNADQLILAYTH